MHTDPTDISPSLISPLRPHVMVLFGATGDLARRKLIPGLFHLSQAGLLPECRIIGSSLDDLDDEGFRCAARHALDEFAIHAVTDDDWCAFASRLFYVCESAGDEALAKIVEEMEDELGGDVARLHYLSVPPAAAPEVVNRLGKLGLAERARIIMEKPFGTDLASAVQLNDTLHATFDESQIFRIDHFLGKEAALNILAFRFANGLFEPIWNRQHIAHVQIDVPETLSIGHRVPFYEKTGAYRDMMVNHLFQVLAFMAMEPPTALEPRSIGEEKNKVFRSLSPIEPSQVVRGQYEGYLDEPGVRPHSETETFVALRCEIDNWRWAGVPFYLRTGKRMAEGARIISIAFREPPKSMFPTGSGVGAHGPDHLTFDLADASQSFTVVLREAPRAGHDARQAEPPVRAARDGADDGPARSVRAPDLRRDERRSHPVHECRGHRTAVGAFEAAARESAAGPALLAGLVGTERDPSADRARRMAPAVRTRLAQRRDLAMTPG